MAERDLVENEVVVLDYGTFENKHFLKCKIVFRGGQPPRAVNCVFDTCEFIFEGPALNTVQFLHNMAGGPGNTGGKEFALAALGLAK